MSKLTIAEAARALGIARSTLVDWDIGRVVPRGARRMYPIAGISSSGCADIVAKMLWAGEREDEGVLILTRDALRRIRQIRDRAAAPTANEEE